MRSIVVEGKFKSDLKSIKKDPHYKEQKLKEYLTILQSGGKLPDACKDHMSPKGSLFDGYRNFHLSPDICVLYRLTDNELFLHRIGTHSDLKIARK